MNPELFHAFQEKVASVVELVDMSDDEIQYKFADDALGGILAGRAYWETLDEAEKLGIMSTLRSAGSKMKSMAQGVWNDPNKKNVALGTGGGIAAGMGLGAAMTAKGGGNSRQTNVRAGTLNMV